MGEHAVLLPLQQRYCSGPIALPGLWESALAVLA